MNLTENINKIFPVFELILSREDLSDFKNTDKNELYLHHFGLGIWIRNNLLIEKSELYQLFVENNIMNKDGMSSEIIGLFHDYLTQKTK